MHEPVTRRALISVAACLPLFGVTGARAQRDARLAQPDFLAEGLADCGLDARDPLLLLAAARVARQRGDVAAQLWIDRARIETVGGEMAKAIGRASVASAKSDTVWRNDAMQLAVGEERALPLPQNKGRIRFRAWMRRPGPEQVLRLAQQGRAGCLVHINGARLAGTSDAPSISHGVALPWDVVLEPRGKRHVAMVRNTHRVDVIFAYSATPLDASG